MGGRRFVCQSVSNDESFLIISLCAVVIAAIVSMLFYYVFTAVSSGFAIIISAVGAALLAAWLFPIKDDEEVEEA